MDLLFILCSVAYALFTLLCFSKAVLHSGIIKKYNYKKQFIVNVIINVMFIIFIFILLLTKNSDKASLITLFSQIIITVIHVMVINVISLIKRKQCLDNRLSLIYNKFNNNNLNINDIRKKLVEEYGEIYFQKEIERAIIRRNK